MSDIVKYNFHGDMLDCVKEGASLFVSIRRVCDSLGIDTQGQLAKLKNKPWATIELISMVAEDGKAREISCISLDSLPMWLSHIEASRVRPAFRDKLSLYQVECARVLRDYFFGPKQEPRDSRIDAIEGQLIRVIDLVTRLVEKPIADSQELGQRDGDEVRSKIRQIASNMAIGTTNPKAERASWRTKVDRELRRQFNHDGYGSSWNTLPKHKRADLMRLLNSKIAESEKVASSRWVQPQLRFPKAV